MARGLGCADEMLRRSQCSPAHIKKTLPQAGPVTPIIIVLAVDETLFCGCCNKVGNSLSPPCLPTSQASGTALTRPCIHISVMRGTS